MYVGCSYYKVCKVLYYSLHCYMQYIYALYIHTHTYIHTYIRTVTALSIHPVLVFLYLSK
jgi:hypothetical protein